MNGMASRLSTLSLGLTTLLLAKVPDAEAEVSSGDALLSVPEARRFMVSLINRDRATMHLPPVELDEGPPTLAAQRHAVDMASHGFLGHWGTDGSVPEQRHTEAGGVDMVLENAACVTDEKSRVLADKPKIAKADVVEVESRFFNEKPPMDGHRRNILMAQHVRVGIGLAKTAGSSVEMPATCLVQEFVDPYGTYEKLPSHIKVGDKLTVRGVVKAPATVIGVGLARIPLPKALPVSEANARRSYPVPAPYVTYWPEGYQTPLPLETDGHKFAITVPVSDGGKAGLYEVSVWAKLPGSKDNKMVSLRTLRVEP